MSGFFCKICLKFFYDAEKAKITHCQSATHFEEYQVREAPRPRVGSQRD